MKNLAGVGSYGDYIGNMPLDFLRVLATNLKLPIPEPGRGRGQSGFLREKLCKDLISFYNQPSNLEVLWQRIETEGRYMLELVFFTAGPEGSPAAKVHGKLNNLWGEEVTRHVRDKLLGLGLLFLSRVAYRQEFYHVPFELGSFLYHKKIQTLIEPLRPDAERGENHGKFLLVDFYIFLACVLQWRIKVTNAGHIYKKDRKKIASLLHYPELPERYEFLESLAWRLGFLVKDQENNVCWSERVWDWIRLHPLEQWYQFVTWIIEKDLEDSRQYSWLEHILNLVLALPPGRWMSLANLYRLIGEYSLGYWRQYLVQRAKECLEKLLWTGLIEVRGDWEKGAIKASPLLEFYLRMFNLLRHNEEIEGEHAELWPEAGELFPQVDTLVVQPNFEILAPLEVSPLLFMQLSSFSDLQSADRMFIFKLSHQSFYRGFMSGWLPEEMIKILVERSKYELPPNVRSSLEEWSGKMGKVYLERGVLVRCEEGLSEEVKAFLQRHGWLVEQLGPGTYLVPEDIAQVCLNRLEAEGFFPRSHIVEHRTRSDEDDFDEYI
ncbi:helicase-associated domain-containing protein [Moorellaceae bacterium AZ2]